MAQNGYSTDFQVKKQLFSLSCPYCHHSFQIMKDTLVIEGMEGKAKERIRDDTYFVHQCSKCHRIYHMVYPFIYRKPKQFVLVLGNEKGSGFDERVYCCQDVHQFTTLFRILEDGADWKEVFYLEMILKQKYNGSVEFESYDQEGKIYYFLVDSQIKAIRSLK